MTALLRRLLDLPVLKNAGAYTLFNGLAALFPLLVLPLLTRRVTPEDYGVYAIFLVGVNLLMPLVGIGFETAAGRRYVDRKEIDFAGYVATGLLTTIVLGLVVYVAMVLAAPALDGVVSVTAAWFPVWVAVAWAQTVSGLILSLHQMAQKPVLFGLWRIGRAALLNVGLAVIVLFGLTGWSALISIQLAAHGAIALLGLAWLARHGHVSRSLRLDHLRHLIRYGGPLIPHMLGAAVVTATDRILLANLIGDGAAGVYTVGYQFGLGMFLFGQSVTRAWTPWFYERLKDGSEAALMSATRMGYGIAASIMVAATGYAIVGWIALPWIVGETYEAASPVFAWIVAAFAAQSLWGLVSSYLYYDGRTEWISASSIGAAVLNVLFTYLLIQWNGMAGAAQATCLAYVLSLAVIILVTVRAAPLPWALRRPSA